MINNNYNRLVNTFGLVEDKELDMIGCSLIIVLRDYLGHYLYARFVYKLFRSYFVLYVLQRTNKVRKRANIRNRYNKAQHLTQYTKGKVTTSQFDITNESQEVSPFLGGDHKASINRRARNHNKSKTGIS